MTGETASENSRFVNGRSCRMRVSPFPDSFNLDDGARNCAAMTVVKRLLALLIVVLTATSPAAAQKVPGSAPVRPSTPPGTARPAGNPPELPPRDFKSATQVPGPVGREAEARKEDGIETLSVSSSRVLNYRLDDPSELSRLTEPRPVLRAYQRARITTLAQSRIDTTRVRVISFVNDIDTEIALARSPLTDRVLRPASFTVNEVRKLMLEHRNAVFILIAHIDGALSTFGGMPIEQLIATAHETRVPTLFIGCKSSQYFGSGSLLDVNSVDVISRLSAAMASVSMGQFLAELGNGLHLSLRNSLVEAMHERLTVEFWADGTPSPLIGSPLAVIATGFQGDFGATGSQQPKEPNRLLAFAVGFTATAVLSLIVSLAAPVFSSIGAMRVAALPMVCVVGRVTIVLGKLGAVALGALITVFLIGSVIPDHTVWVLILGLPLLAVWHEVVLEGLRKATETPLKRAHQITVGLLIFWSVGGLLTLWTL